MFPMFLGGWFYWGDFILEVCMEMDEISPWRAELVGIYHQRPIARPQLPGVGMKGFCQQNGTS